ncbi:transaldolase B [Pseudomonas mandelii JR-1]|uniref:Transaldolase B n=1 Tax=Pseudomonas mandelii JR-1 TaxID=1147786 RepID=A0A024EJ02_9PSED|nr:transaldolase B [Pseudomonas mandelii JR-1]
MYVSVAPLATTGERMFERWGAGLGKYDAKTARRFKATDR